MLSLFRHANLTVSSILPQKPQFIETKLHASVIISKKYSSSRLRTATAAATRTNVPEVAVIEGKDALNEDEYQSVGLQRDRMPKHVAVILDGSRRWCKANGRTLDYQMFFKSNTLFADLCLKWGVGTATTYVYSLKNLERGQQANELIFGQLKDYLEDNLEDFKRKGIKVWMIGEKTAIPDSLKATIEKVEEATKNNAKLEWMLAICYGGTNEMAQAVRRICGKVKDGAIDPEDVDEDLVEQELWTRASRAPHPDLLIRTGGRIRVSNYLIWQSAQTELYFTNTLAPEFGEADFIEAMRAYQKRDRLFGH